MCCALFCSGFVVRRWLSSVDVVGCGVSLFKVGCSLLFVAMCCCVLLIVVVRRCSLLSAIDCCLLLVVAVSCYRMLSVVVRRCLLSSGVLGSWA